MKNRGLHLYCLLVAVAMLVLVVTGAMAASHEGVESGGHRSLGLAMVVLFVGLAIWLKLAEPLPWLRRLGWAALGGSAVDGGLGFLAGPSSPAASMAHAFLAPILLAVVTAICVGTSRTWKGAPISLQDQGWPPLRGVARNTLLLVVIQVALGSAFRYGAVGVMTHILGALVVVIFILTLVVLVTMMPEHPTLRPAAITLGVVTFVQIFLGLTVISMGSLKGAQTAGVILTVAHVATGAITLSLTLVVALETWRCVRPASQTVQAGNDQSLGGS